METFAIKAFQLILAFAILVIIHEFGHFLFARIFGVKVEKFYIFFNPITSLFKWKPRRYVGLLKKKYPLNGADQLDVAEQQADEEEDRQMSLLMEEARANLQPKYGDNPPKDKIEQEACRLAKNLPRKKRGFWSDTEYGVGWLPLGGYCKIAGMIDESMDTEQMQRPPKHWEFRAKPAWQRLLIMIAGVLFNFLLAILIYAGIVYATGERYVPLNEARNGMVFSKAAIDAGFRNGDIPVAADGSPLPENPGLALSKIIAAKSVTVMRDGQRVDIEIPEKFIFALDNEAKADTASFSFMTYAMPARVTQVVAGEGADKAGLRPGDEIVAIDSISTPTVYSFMSNLRSFPGRTVKATILRPSSIAPDSINIVPRDTLIADVRLNSGAKMGIGLEVRPDAFFKSEEIHYNIFQSIPRGVQLGTSTLTSYAKSMKQVFTKEGAQSIGGFGAIGSIFPEKWDWIAFWNIAAFLSVALAFMNILPIPALDGGHVLFLLYEVITGRKPSEKFMEWAQMIGMGLLILLLLYANGMDIVRLFK